MVAVVSLENNKDINEDSLVDATRSYIAGYKLPKKVIFVEQVERAPNGKANYKSVSYTHLTLPTSIQV